MGSYIYKQYSIFFRIRIFLRLGLSLNQLLGPLWAQPEEWFVLVSQMGTGQEASSLRHLGISTFIPPKSCLHSLNSSLAVALSGLLKSTLFKTRTESRSPQSSLQPYHKGTAPQMHSTALISSLWALEFVDNVLLW